MCHDGADVGVEGGGDGEAGAGVAKVEPPDRWEPGGSGVPADGAEHVVGQQALAVSAGGHDFGVDPCRAPCVAFGVLTVGVFAQDGDGLRVATSPRSWPTSKQAHRAGDQGERDPQPAIGHRRLGRVRLHQLRR